MLAEIETDELVHREGWQHIDLVWWDCSVLVYTTGWCCISSHWWEEIKERHNKRELVQFGSYLDNLSISKCTQFLWMLSTYIRFQYTYQHIKSKFILSERLSYLHFRCCYVKKIVGGGSIILGEFTEKGDLYLNHNMSNTDMLFILRLRLLVKINSY